MELKAKKILLSVVKDAESVKYHDGWGWYIETPFNSIKKIGLIPNEESFELSFYFGDSQSQSRDFYTNIKGLHSVINTKWSLKSNFHFSSTFRNLIWFESKLNPNDYINFWKRNSSLLKQHSIDKLQALIDLLSNRGVILLDDTKKADLEKIIFLKEYKKINVCAGFGAIYSISKIEIDKLEVNDLLKKFIKTRINEGLSIIGENGNFF